MWWAGVERDTRVRIDPPAAKAPARPPAAAHRSSATTPTGGRRRRSAPQRRAAVAPGRSCPHARSSTSAVTLDPPPRRAPGGENWRGAASRLRSFATAPEHAPTTLPDGHRKNCPIAVRIVPEHARTSRVSAPRLPARTLAAHRRPTQQPLRAGRTDPPLRTTRTRRHQHVPKPPPRRQPTRRPRPNRPLRPLARDPDLASRPRPIPSLRKRLRAQQRRQRDTRRQPHAWIGR